MKVSLRWLSRYVDLDDLSPRQVLDDLTMSTCEVEGIEAFADGIDDVRVGRVVECGRHPDADKLSLTRVDTGAGELAQVVCGAPNVAQGQIVAVALPGASLPGGIKIKKTKIRGAESCGMICSEKELGLSGESDGIVVLEPGLTLGRRLVDVLPLRDHVLEIDNKSINHRPDLWGHHGIARELAAIHGRPLRPLCERVELPRKGRALPIRIDDPVGCPRYTGLVVEGVSASPSPAWLRYLLHAVGQRSIDLLVDLTNFVMLALGQPMHAFDVRRLDAGGIGVRRARAGETLRTLDGQERKLAPDDLLITSGDRPVALAGIMGGEGSAIAPDTRELFLESANFHPAVVRRTSTRLGLRTDSSARFEKALDPAFAELGVHAFVGLLQELCPGARPAGPLGDPSGFRYTPKPIRLRQARVDLKLGLPIEPARIRGILTGLEFGVSPTGDGFDVTVPSFRATKDITIEDDLIEEVGRMFRYDNIPEAPLRSVDRVPVREPEPWLARKLVELCATELGCHEVHDYSFVPDGLVRACRAGDHRYVGVTNPVTPETARLRRHVAPSLLGALSHCLTTATGARLCEDGKGYQPEVRDEHGLPGEVRELAVVFATRNGPPAYDELRERMAILCERTGHPPRIESPFVHDDVPWMHPGRTAAIECGTEVVGYVGTVHPEVCRNLKLPATTALASLDLRAMLRAGRTDLRYRPISPFPPQIVDVALLVPREARVADVAALLRDCGKKLVQAVELFEVYTGAGIPDDRKSLNFTVTLGATDRTLADADGERFLGRVRERVRELGGEMRG
jgi:phenylalanyl-tRNA synthetase beta chain